ncbi:MAG: serine/threonine phosphatase [Cyanobacteria bacterium J06632_22]
MIVCSQCQSENPSGHRFCQQCGAPLKLWRATVAADTAVTAYQLTSKVWYEPVAAPVATGLKQGDYLDIAGRYRLLEDLSLQAGRGQALVTDSEPHQAPPLQQHIEGDLGDLGQPLPREQWRDADLAYLLPAAAYPYLKLQERFFPAIPSVHGAWVTPERSIVVIEDRSDLPPLFEVWRSADFNAIQQVHCLYAMAELWEVLAEVQGQGSLLKLDNLYMDEDQIFCLGSIEQTAGDRTLIDLSLLWQSLLSAAQTPLMALQELNQQLISGEIIDVNQLKDLLVDIADELHPSDVDDPDASGDLEMVDPLAAIALAETALPPDSEPVDMPTMVLPMKLIGLEEAGLTHVGQQRDHNEDAYFIQSALRKQDSPKGQKLEAQCLYILCDGMGGHAGGEVASDLAVKTLQTYFTQNWSGELPAESQIKAAIGEANQAIYDLNEAESRTGAARMGTTLVLLLLSNTQAAIAHVGDSRLYRYTRRLGLQQLTVDHEVGQREIQRGVEPAIAYARPDAYQLTQALGPRDNTELDPSVTFLNFTEDTLLLLCSDGLSDHDLIETHCQSHIDPLLRGPKNTEEGVADLIDLANEINGHDNITAVAVKLKVKPNMDHLQMG